MKQVLPFLYCILFSCCSLFAQEENFQIPDSLADKTNPELKKLAKIARYRNLTNATVYTETLYKRATEQQNQIDVIESFFYFGHIAFLNGEYTQTISQINKGIALANTDQDSILRKLYAVRGNTYEAYGQYEAALEDYETMLIIAKKYKDTKGILIAETSLAKLKINNKQYHEALKAYRNYYKISNDSTQVSKNSRVSIIIAMSDIFLKMEALDSARVYIDLGLKESKKIDDKDSACYFYTYDGIYEYYKGDIPKALEKFEKARKLISVIQSEQKLNIEVFYYMAQCHFALKDYQASIQTINKAYEIIREENSKREANRAQKSEESYYTPYEHLYFKELLVRCYEKLGDEKNRDLYWEEYSKLELESNKKIYRINASIYELLDREERTAFIERQSNRKVAAETQVEYLYYILGLLCVIGLISYILYRKKDQQKELAYKKLIEKVSALEAKSTPEIISDDSTSAKKTVSITDEKAQAILKGLKKFEAQELYLDSNCSLRFVAKKVKTNATYLSKIINEEKEISFTDYINNLRIQYTLKRLKSDSLFRAYSIKSISEEVGYKSADSFTKHFKKQTSLYPSYYIKKLNQEEA
ncbi:AraC family transcriptional regulator [uncultured Kordia sp.]|uniref:AraC family transcriptional regulator n=1 Tax=uncultured Kordia sp. TaxID=507699 RepID=UPI0026303FEE|nr:AraC family transcriptional regulator [uncultured Kordia sp.]